jgi:hypothetical protein
MLAGVLWLGFLLGLRHAFEADHLAAVTTLATRSARRADTLRVAVAWGLGHTLTLTLAGTLMVAAGVAWSPGSGWARLGELIAGGLLLWLGADGVGRALAVRQRAAGPTRAAPLSRALVVGGVHGLEGSGAVVLLALPALPSVAAAGAYLGLFGAGAIVGMLAATLILSLPLGLAARRWTWGARALQLGVGMTSVLLGAAMTIAAIR